ncbi:MAG: LTA synthase family protein [Synergistaceae bacterium]|nr:LTA synthase family protein [Synergistaceae bacterium]MBP9958834.1 LTA synthase family protein [Synergistaceae bacterium]
MGVLFCLVAPILLFPKRLRGVSFILLNLVLSFLILTDTLYMRYYTDLFTLRNLGLSAQAGAVADSIFMLLRPGDVFIFMDLIPLIMGVFWLNGRHLWGEVDRYRVALAGVLILSGASATVYKLLDYDRSCRGAMYAMWDRPAVCVGTGSLSYHAIDAWNTVSEVWAKKPAGKSEITEIETWLTEWNRESSTGSTFGAAKGKNLILIQVESLQAFAVGLKVGGVEVTPHLNRFRKEGVHFTRGYNQTANGNSSDAEFMANTSLFPIAKGVAYMRYPGNEYHSLGTMLADEGYSTLALHGDRPGFWNRNHIYPSLGFQRYVSNMDFKKEESIGLGLSDRSFFRQSLDILKTQSQPFYAFLITLTSHYPFNFPALKEQVSSLPLGDLEETLLGDYLRSIHYTDRHLGEFLKGLSESGLLEKSVIVVYGDHPAIPIGDRERLSKLLGRNLESAAAWREIQKVPLMVRLPGKMIRGERDTPTGQMDIAPTVANLMGLSMKTAFGRDLFNTQGGAVLFRNGSYVDGTNWIDPQREAAWNLATDSPIEYADQWIEKTNTNRRHLSFSDRVIESNLLPLLLFSIKN